MKCLKIFILILILSACKICAESADANRVFNNAVSRFTRINDYSVSISLSVKSPSMSLDNANMKFYYKKPNKTRVVAEQSFGLLTDNIGFRNPLQELTQNGKPVYIKNEKLDGINCYVFKIAKEKNSNKPDTFFWMDKRQSNVISTKTTGIYNINTKWKWINIDGKYNLPCKIIANTEMPAGKGKTEKTIITVCFSNYKVNKGISDSIFMAKKTAQR